MEGWKGCEDSWLEMSVLLGFVTNTAGQTRLYRTHYLSLNSLKRILNIFHHKEIVNIRVMGILSIPEVMISWCICELNLIVYLTST